MSKGTLYLIPTAIAADSQDKLLTPQLAEVLKSTRYFIAEHVREARRFISSLKLGITIEELKFSELDKHNHSENFKRLLTPALEGENLGLMSDAGCPGVADPGAEIVQAAHDMGIKVVPLVGPSSILLSLMASGLSGQNFRFNGYLPIDSKELKNKIRELEQHSRKYNESQIFIETPYRSDKMLRILIDSLSVNTRLVVATGLTGKDESITSHKVAQWRKTRLVISKVPTVFLFLA
jgi:16S rRNA (cytidine1402-2'-O)-methyltransferase